MVFIRQLGDVATVNAMARLYPSGPQPWLSIRLRVLSDQQPDIRGKGQPIPPLGRTVLVRCPGFRCLANRDKDGKWRDVAHDEERPEILEILWEF
jgi:hypothetical protein